jgi:hypothetical protein
MNIYIIVDRSHREDVTIEGVYRTREQAVISWEAFPTNTNIFIEEHQIMPDWNLDELEPEKDNHDVTPVNNMRAKK